jgi:GLPGLI family protein
MFCQVGNAVYGKQLESLPSDTKNVQVKKILQILKTYEYQLTFKDRKAVYKKLKSLNNDKNLVLTAMTKGLANFTGSCFFDDSRKIILHQREFAGSNYIIKKNTINWILTKDTLKIDNYLCYKATTTYTIENTKGKHKIEVIAWYTPEISLPYGPDGYGGLPGLILQLNHNGIITSLKKIEFLKNDKTTDIELPKKGEKVSEDEFNNIVAKQIANRKNKY